jgi:hypothetical protein
MKVQLSLPHRSDLCEACLREDANQNNGTYQSANYEGIDDYSKEQRRDNKIMAITMVEPK